MFNSRSSLALSVALVAVLMPLCVDWTQAQKTLKNSFQQAVSSGSAPQSVYGGYQTSSSSSNFNRQQPLVAPVQQQQQRRTQQTYSSRQRVQSVQQPVYQQQQESAGSSSSSSYDQAEADAEPASYGSVNGQPGVDFPAYTRVPKTSFSCDGLPYDYGMYADEETGCQAYHVCYNGRKDSFLCGVGTVFNQRILHCDYWYSVDCGKSSQYYGSNAYMGSSQPEPGPAQAGVSPVVQPQQQQQSSSSSYQRTQSASALSPTINRPANFQRAQQSSSFNRNTVQQTEEAY